MHIMARQHQMCSKCFFKKPSVQLLNILRLKNNDSNFLNLSNLV